MKIFLSGYGKMGRMLEELALERGWDIVGHADITCPEAYETAPGADVCLDFSEYDIQDKGAEKICQRHNQNREDGGEQDQLLGCFLCDIRPPATEILAADDRTSGRERGKQVDQKDKYIVNERYGRDGCLTGTRNHHRVSGADCNG